MKYLKYLQTISLVVLMLLMACEPKDIELVDNDIVYPKSEISSFSPASGLIGTTVELSGLNMDDPKLQVYLGNTECTILSKTGTKATIQLPRVVKSNYFTSINSLGARYTTAEKFEVSYPNTTIDESSLSNELFKDVGYKITGTNLDLLSEVIFSDTTILIDGSQVGDPNVLVIITQESNASKPKFKAEEKISFKCRAGNDLPSKIGIVVMETYPSTNLVVVDPKVATIGDEVKFIFEDFSVATLISSIVIGGVDATFSFEEPYVLVTIPEGAADGSISITNSYGVVKTYANGEKLSLN